jgi:hypothetical protein
VEDLLAGRRVRREGEGEGEGEGPGAGGGTAGDRLRLFLLVYLTCRLDEEQLAALFDILR